MSNVETTAGPATQENQRPEWLPENFESPEALVKSYGEAQRKITEQGQQLSELNETVESLSEWAAQLQQAPPQQQAIQQNPIETIAAQYGVDPDQIQLMAQLAAQASQYAVEQALQAQQPEWQRGQQAQIETVAEMATNHLRAQYPDWGEYESQVEETIKGNQGLIQALQSARTPSEFASVLESGYKLSKWNDLVSGQAQTAQAEAAKLAAQSATGAGPGRIMSPSEQQAEWERIRNAAPSNPWGAGA